MSRAGFTLWLGAGHALLLPPMGTPVRLQPTAEDGRIMQALCRADPMAPLRIICDSPHIRLQSLTLPPVGWLDRQKLLARELARHDIAVSLRQPHGDQLATIDQDPALSFWLEQIAALPNPFDGLSLTPVILARLFKKLHHNGSDWHMLLTWSDSGGLRQVVLHQGQIFLTRQISVTEPEQLATEIATTTIYLARHGLSDSSQLQITIMLPHSIISKAKPFIPKDNIKILTPENLAQQLGLSSTSQLEPLLDSWSNRNWRKFSPIIPPSLRLRNQTQNIDQALRRISAAIWLGLLISLGWQSASLLTLFSRNEKLTSENKLLATAYHTTYQPVAALIAPLEAMRQAEARQALFQSPVVTPAVLLNQMQTNWPDTARVQKLEWLCPDGKESTEQLTLELSVSTTPPIEQLQAELPDYQVSNIQDGPNGPTIQIRRSP